MLIQLKFDTRTRFPRTFWTKLESLKNVKAISVGDVRRVEPSLEEGSRGLLNVLMHL